jgi:hypothetical protein
MTYDNYMSYNKDTMMNDKNIEIWKDIPLLLMKDYQASNLGRIRHFISTINRYLIIEDYILKNEKLIKVKLNKNSSVVYFVDRLIGITFNPVKGLTKLCDNYYYDHCQYDIIHLNANVLDCNCENLVWVGSNDDENLIPSISSSYKLYTRNDGCEPIFFKSIDDLAKHTQLDKRLLLNRLLSSNVITIAGMLIEAVSNTPNFSKMDDDYPVIVNHDGEHTVVNNILEASNMTGIAVENIVLQLFTISDGVYTFTLV